MRKKINLIKFTALVSACFLLLLSCGMPPRQNRKGKIEVTFWHAMAGAHLKIVNKFAEEFEKQNPDIKITPVYQGGYDALHQKLIAALTAGTHPSMSQMYESWTTRFIERDLIDPVQSFIDADKNFNKEDLNDFFPVFKSNCEWDGKLVTIPFNKSAYLLFCNQDMLQANGFSGPPKDWDEFLEQSKKVTKVEDGKTVRYGFAIRPFIEGLTPFIFANDMQFMNEDGTKILIGNKDGVDTLTFMVDLVQKYKVAYVDTDYLTAPFGAQRIAMYVGSTASFPYNDKAVGNRFKWVASPIPSPKGKDGKVLFQGTNIGIFKRIDKREREAAWKFLQFMTNTKNSTTWAIETGYLPIRRSCLNEEEMKKYLDNNPNYNVVLTQMDKGAFEPRFVYWESIREIITREFEGAINGRKSVQEGVKNIESKCDFIIRTER